MTTVDRKCSAPRFRSTVIAGLLTFSIIVSDSAQAEEKHLEGHIGPVMMGRFVPNSNLVITCGGDGSVRVWNADTAAEVRQYRQHTAPVLCLDVTATGRMAASGGQDNTVRLWRLPATEPLARQVISQQPVRALRFDPTSGSLFAISSNLAVIALDSFDSSDTSAKQSSAGENPTAFGLRTDGTVAAIGSNTGQVTVWSPLLSESLFVFQAHTTPIVRTWFGGSSLFTAGQDGNVKSWQISDALAGKKVKADDGTESPAVPKEINAFRTTEANVVDIVTFSNGTQFLTLPQSGPVTLTDAGGKQIRAFSAPQPSHSLAVRTDGQRVVCGGSTGQVLVFQGSDSTLLQTLQVQPPTDATDKTSSAVTHLAWSPDNSKLAVVTGQSRVDIFGPSLPGAPQQELVLHQTFRTNGPVTDMLFAPDSEQILTSHTDGSVSQWQYASPVQLRQLSHQGAVYGIAFSGDGKSVLTCGADQTVRVWDTFTGQQKFQMRGHLGAVHSIAVNSDDTLAVTSGADGSVRIWDIVGGRQLRELTRKESTMYSVAFHSNGQHIVAAGADRLVSIIDASTGETIRTLEGHSDYIHSLTLSADGKHLLTYGYAGNLRKWNYDQGTLASSTQAGKIGNSADLSPDGRRILTANGDGVSRIVSLP